VGGEEPRGSPPYPDFVGHRRLTPVTVTVTVTVTATIAVAVAVPVSIPVSIPITAKDDYAASASIMRSVQVMPEAGTAMDLIGKGNISDRTTNAGWCKRECVCAVCQKSGRQERQRSGKSQQELTHVSSLDGDRTVAMTKNKNEARRVPCPALDFGHHHCQ
jgi:hypothetical protein